MREELDTELCRKHPKIFRDRHAPMTDTCMCWGFEHGDGWYNIIDQLCHNMQRHIDWTRRERADALRYNRALNRAVKGDFASYDRLPKWVRNSIDKAMLEPKPQQKPIPEACPQVVATQVKEKYGTLRFYYYGGDDVIDGMVSLAESMSAVTCEVCGGPAGKPRTYHYVRTLCDEHYREIEKGSFS